ncbi:hypothetical protein VNO77_14163 [Canavalia gladiata]|uniref:Uncharacterized protein n=1 Tax=Canavalia gladiata TaxID=3824 RepID=A0AAN9M3A4_CANGL
MAFASVLVLFALLMQPLLSTSATLFPNLGDDFCKIAQCGKGTCKASNNSIFKFECECDSGWKNLVDVDANLNILPCIISNCTLNYTCSNASPTTPPFQKRNDFNTSIFEGSFGADCAGIGLSVTTNEGKITNLDSTRKFPLVGYADYVHGKAPDAVG